MYEANEGNDLGITGGSGEDVEEERSADESVVSGQCCTHACGARGLSGELSDHGSGEPGEGTAQEGSGTLRQSSHSQREGAKNIRLSDEKVGILVDLVSRLENLEALYGNHDRRLTEILGWMQNVEADCST